MQTQGLPAAAALTAGDQAVAAAEGPPLKTARAPLSGEFACPTSPAASPAAPPPGCPPPADATAAPPRCAPCPASLGSQGPVLPSEAAPPHSQTPPVPRHPLTQSPLHRAQHS